MFIQLLVRGSTVLVNSEQIESVFEDDDDTTIVKMISGATHTASGSVDWLTNLLVPHEALAITESNEENGEDEENSEEE